MAEEVVLRTEDLGLTIGGNRILQGLTLAVREGEFLAIIGPNGAGKTSLFNLLSGLYRATTGRIFLDGRDITDEPPFRRARMGLGRSFQISSVFPLLSVLENARLAAQAHLGGSLSLWGRVTGGEAVERARRALELAGLTGREDLEAASLSHGDKRKLEVAILLAGEPRVLLLDEPTAGMSVEDVPDLMGVIRSIPGNGRTVLMVEHRMDVVVDLADRIAVIHHGSLLACDTPEAVMGDQAVQEAYLGEPM